MSTATADMTVRRSRLRRIRREHVFAVLSPLTLLIAWEIASRGGMLDERIFSKPTTIVEISWEMIKDGELIDATLITLQRLAIGMAVGALPGIAIGLAMGLSRNVRAVVNPIVSATYPLPRIAMFPLVLLVVGLNETSIIIMVALGPFFTMIISTMAGVQNLPPIYQRVARSFNVSTKDMYLKVLLPAALPIIISGIRISLGLGLLGVVAAEFLVSDSGLGYLIWHSWQILSLPESMVGLVTAGLLGFVLFLLLDLFERVALPYRPEA